MHHFLLILHILSASVWIGGHLILAIRYVPEAIKLKSNLPITNFRNKFEPLGMLALIILVITGVAMAYDYDVKIDTWFSFFSPIEKVISSKLILFVITVISAIFATISIFPKLNGKVTNLLVFFIYLVTIIALTMAVLGTFIRYGGI